MIPSPWTGIVLALAAYRLTRLVGWDDFPLAERVRDWATGKKISRGPHVQGEHYTYKRDTVQKLITCPFCAGFWISTLVLIAWWEFPTETLYALAPFALGAAVGLTAKNLDP